MISTEHISTPSGALYVAEVRASLPTQSEVAQAYSDTHALHELSAAVAPFSLSESFVQHQIAADIRTIEGVPIVHDNPDFCYLL